MTEEQTEKNFTLRAFDMMRDYETICAWWERWKWTPLPPQYLSSNGFVAEVNGVPLAVTFLFITDADFCLMEFLVVNPDLPRADRMTGVDMVVKAAQDLCVAKNYSALFTTTNNPFLKKKLPELGFIMAEENVTHLVWPVTGGGE